MIHIKTKSHILAVKPIFFVFRVPLMHDIKHIFDFLCISLIKYIFIRKKRKLINKIKKKKIKCSS